MTSKLGIFWIYRHEVIFSHSVPLADGLPYDEAITGTKDHADYWEELRSAGELSVLPQAQTLSRTCTTAILVMSSGKRCESIT